MRHLLLAAALVLGAPVAAQTNAEIAVEAVELAGRGNHEAARQPMLAEDVVKQAWLTLRLSEKGQEAVLEAFGEMLGPLHAARVDDLLWRWRTDEAERMLPLLSEDQRALAQARLAYIGRADDIEAKVAAVPEALRDHPGLAYDRYNWLAGKGQREEAITLLLERSSSVETLGVPFRWSGWRRSLARWEMRNGDPARAYEIAANHRLLDSTSMADLEWIAGYLSLTYLGKPEQALEHFRAGWAAVTSPISVSRMAYWTGRAQRALGRSPEAAFQAAAKHQTAFYGLLAAEELGLTLDPALTGRADADDWQGAAVMQDDLVRAAFLLLEGGERGAAVTFFVQIAQDFEADDLARIGARLDAMGESFYEVLLGKAAVQRGVMVPSIYFPLHDLAQMDLPAEPALSLAVARRESEFNPVVGSSVGALGLMQLMPATAEEVSGFIGEPYSRARLTSDWEYNARLGAKYLQVLEEQFGPSPVMIAAGYNAGPSRPELWMDERGDPRIGEADVIDWIEHIPFRETRNYVMRVTESIPVYRARLTGEVGPVQFTRLLKGEKPLIRPVPRPVVSPEARPAAPATE